MHPFVEAEKVAGHSVNNACRLLEGSRSAFYARTLSPASQRALTDAELLEQIRFHPRGVQGHLWITESPQGTWTSRHRLR